MNLSDYLDPTPEWDGTLWYGGYFYSGREPSSPKYDPAKNGRPHRGIDQDAPEGSDILAPADGIVVAALYSGGAGNKMVLRHDPTLIDIHVASEAGNIVGRTYELWTRHLHMPHGTFKFGPGDRVFQGDVIGEVGCTGSCAGPHNHTEIRIGHEWGAAIDPLPVYGGENMSEFIKATQEALNEAGFDAGPVDGILGPRTEAAIKARDLAAAAGGGFGGVYQVEGQLHLDRPST